MRRHRRLPDEEQLHLDQLDSDQKAKLLMLFCRAWHLRNDVIHVKGQGSVKESAGFLLNYYESLQAVRKTSWKPEEGGGKSKAVLDSYNSRKIEEHETKSVKPKASWLARTGGMGEVEHGCRMCHMSGMMSTGVVVRDDAGRVLLTAWKLIRRRKRKPIFKELDWYWSGLGILPRRSQIA
jgi:hypothetical protein